MKIIRATASHEKVFLLGGMCFVILGCWMSSAYGAEKNIEDQESDELLLGLVGYNYTNRTIEEYSVDGISGGDISKSSPTSGGGGTTCCVRLPKELQGTVQVTVRWQVDGCRYLMRDSDGKTEEVRHFFYRKEEVNVIIPSGKAVAYLETHFYPNGRPQVRVTEHMSLPALALDKKRPDRSHFPRCKNDQKPE